MTDPYQHCPESSILPDIVGYDLSTGNKKITSAATS